MSEQCATTWNEMNEGYATLKDENAKTIAELKVNKAQVKLLAASDTCGHTPAAGNVIVACCRMRSRVARSLGPWKGGDALSIMYLRARREEAGRANGA